MKRVWFVTGAGRGFGRLFVEGALGRGDPVVGTARRVEQLDDLAREYPETLVVVSADVSNRKSVFAAVERAVNAFGRLDVVVNNAGYGLTGAVEEITEAEARDIMDTNFFGTLWVCQAVVPHLRAQGSGHIVQMSSIAGLIGIPTQGLYAAGKFAVEGMSEALANEMATFGVNVTLVEPGIYGTGFSSRFVEFTEAYQPVRDALMARYADATFGDPAEVVDAIMRLVDSPEPPRRLLLGRESDMIMDTYRRRLEEWQAWREVAPA